MTKKIVQLGFISLILTACEPITLQLDLEDFLTDDSTEIESNDEVLDQDTQNDDQDIPEYLEEEIEEIEEEEIEEVEEEIEEVEEEIEEEVQEITEDYLPAGIEYTFGDYPAYCVTSPNATIWDEPEYFHLGHFENRNECLEEGLAQDYDFVHYWSEDGLCRGLYECPYEYNCLENEDCLEYDLGIRTFTISETQEPEGAGWYEITDFGTNTCPEGYLNVTDIDKCQEAHQQLVPYLSFQGIPHPEFDVSGCYLDILHSRVYMPPESHEEGHGHMAPICEGIEE